MNAPLRSKTTVGQLVYPARPSLNFARVVADLDAALAGAGASERKTTLEGDGLAVIDAGSSRIAVAMAENLDNGGATAITVAVGSGPEEDGDAQLTRRQAVLARMIADRLAARSEPSETIWSESHEIATPEFLARSAEDLAARRRVPQDAETVRAREEAPLHFVGADDIPRLMARVDAAIDARRAGWEQTVDMVASSDLPPVDLAGLEVKSVDTAPTSAPLRLAAHMIDATLMVLLLPVGAAMMVYSLSRGANLNTSARVMAITGVAMSLIQTVGWLGGLRQLLTLSI
jgi:hypothetical protein